MPTIEDIESVVSEGHLSHEGELTIQQFLAQVSHRAETLYDAALTISAQMYDRQQIARFWKDQRELLDAQLATVSRLKRMIERVRDEPAAQVLYRLDQIIANLDELVSLSSPRPTSKNYSISSCVPIEQAAS
jgi:hypothetical protein